MSRNIPKKALRNFLEKPRDDYRKLKKLSRRELNDRIRELNVRPPIWKKLNRHQRVCFVIGLIRRRFAFFLDTGCGKTLLSIALMRYYKRCKEARTFLVLVPNRINTFEWGLEIEKHSPGTRYKILKGSTEDKWEQLRDGECSVLITTYGGFVRMVSKEVVVALKKGQKIELKPDNKKIKEVISNIDGLILDESTAVGNHMSLTHKICLKVAKGVSFVYELTGTPFGKDPEPLWAQLKIVDGGEALGNSVGVFRAVFYNKSIHPFSGFPEYKFRRTKKNMIELNRMIAHSSIRYKADNADLPRLVNIVKEVSLPKDAMDIYQTAKEKLRESKGKVTEMQNQFLRMRQISSGFLGYKDDETGEKAELFFDDNPKLEMLISLIEEVRHVHKIVIFHQYTPSGGMICKRLRELKIKHVRIYGKTKDQEGMLQEFSNDDECRVMVLNNSCGGYGLNLQVAKYGIYYESPVDPITRKQTRRRIERQGSSHDKVFVYDLVARGTVDQRILEALESGRDLFQAVIEGEMEI